MTSAQLGAIGVVLQLKDELSAPLASIRANLKTFDRDAQAASAAVSTGMTGMVSSLKSLAGVMGVAFSVGAMKSWIDSTLTAAGRIQDLSSRLNVSTKAVQQWAFAASQSGGTIDDVAASVSFMNRTLAGDSAEALQKVGLEFNQIRQLKPEEAFNAIVTALGNMEDPMARTRAQYALLGRGSADLSAAIAEGFKNVADGASYMEQETIDRLDAAGDAWDKLTRDVTIKSGELIAGLAKEFSKPNPIDKWFTAVNTQFKSFGLNVDQAIADWNRLVGKTGGAPTAPAPPSIVNPPLVLPVLSPEAQRSLEDALDKQREALDKQREALDAAAKAAEAEARALRLLANQISGLTGIEEAQRLARAVAFNATRGFLTMEDAERKKVNETLYEGIQASERLGRTASASMLRAYKATYDFKDILDDIPPLIQGIDFTKVGQSVTPMRNALGEINQLLGPMALRMDQIVGGEGLGKYILPKDLPLPDASKFFTNTQLLVKEAKEAAKQVGLLFVNDLSTSLADNIRLGDWSQVENQLSSALSGTLSAGVAAAINLFAPGLGTALQPLFQALSEKLMGALGLGTKGRDLVKEFAGTVGGFDALRAQLATLGPEGEKLWIALTQGVGRNNPKQAQDAIDAVKKAVANTPEALAGAAGYQTMAELQAVAKKAKSTYDYLVESGKYSAEQIATAFKVYQEAANAAMGDSAKAAIAASGAMTAAIQKDLDALGSARDSLVQSIANEAPEEVMGVIEAETRARIAQVEAEIQAKQAQLDAATAAAKAAADAALVATKMAFDETRTEAANTDRDIRERFGKPIRIPIEFVYPGGVVPPGGVGVPPVGNSTGRPPRGSDGAGEQTTITIPLYIDGEMVAESVVRTAKRFGAA